MRWNQNRQRILVVAAWLATLAVASAQNLGEFERSLSEFTLDNGMRFLVLERREAPVVSFHTLADVGSADDPQGKTGMAHMFEHMAFKGTPTIGTVDFAAEQELLDQVDRAHQALENERRKGPRADADRLKQLEESFRAAVEEASRQANSEEFTRLIEESGGTGLNAYTSMDQTGYMYSLPSNRLELWFYLESERFLRPVMREFYKERDVVREERRMRIESNPLGKLIEAFLGAAYQAHPYGRPGVGWPSDIANLSVPEAKRFFETYYAPDNLTAAIVGDVDPDRVRRLAEAYFGRLEKRPPAPRVVTEELPQEGERRVEIVSQAQPMLVLGYHKPSKHHPDRAVFNVISSVLSGGRTGWFYKELVRDRQIALQAGGFPDFPGNKFASLFVFFSLPSPNHSVEENEEAMYELIEKLKTEPVDEQTLAMVKTKARAALISKLESNAGLAAELASHQVGYGDWRQLFYSLEETRAVTADDVQRVAKQYFKPAGRTVAYLVQPSSEKESDGDD